MKKIFLLSMTLLIILHSGIIESLFDIKQESIREEVQSKLELKESFVLKISLKDFKAISMNHHEVLIKGAYHDIVSFKKINNTVYVTLLKDKEENNFLTKVKDYKEKNSSPKNKTISFKNKMIFCCIHTQFHVDHTTKKILPVEQFFYKTVKLPIRLGEIIIPPPELA